MTPWLVLLVVALVVELWGYLDGRNVVTLSRVFWRLREGRPWLAWLVAAFFCWLWWHWFS